MVSDIYFPTEALLGLVGAVYSLWFMKRETSYPRPESHRRVFLSLYLALSISFFTLLIIGPFIVG